MTSDNREWIRETAKAAAWKDGLEGLNFEDDVDNKGDEHPYSIESGHLTYRSAKKDKTGEILEYVPTKLSNFDARITGERIYDDGQERRIHLLIEGTLDNGVPLPPIDIDAKDFNSMAWVPAAWGGRAIIGVGAFIRDSARAAIQYLSGQYPTRTIYTHTGWRLNGGKWLFLHVGGAITADGCANDVDVNLEDSRLRYYRLPEPPSGDDLIRDINETLLLLPDSIDYEVPESAVFPDVCLAFRAPLCELCASENTDLVVGQTGILKTAHTAVYQAFFGSGFTAETLPAAWESTANALEKLAYRAKDVYRASIFVLA
jgi:hypothetical protein